MVLLFSIDGNIGSGKSTLLRHVSNIVNSHCLGEYANDYEVVFLQEPVDEWMGIKDKNGRSVISLFYEDQKRYAFSFQMMAYISRLDLLKKIMDTSKKVVVLSERSVHTDKYVFAKMLYDSAIMTDVEYQIYNKWFDSFISEIHMQGVIYLKTDPVNCQKRVHQRSRDGEVMDLRYLESCHAYHDEYVKRFRLLELDGNRPFDEMKDDAVREMTKFIYESVKEVENK